MSYAIRQAYAMSEPVPDRWQVLDGYHCPVAACNSAADAAFIAAALNQLTPEQIAKANRAAVAEYDRRSAA